MRSISSKIATVLALLLVLNGCTKELPFNPKDVEAQLVVSGFMKAGQPIEVVISRSFGLLDDTINYRVEDAIVELTFNNTVVSTLEHTEKGHYSSSLIAEQNGIYAVRVTHPDFPEAIGMDTIPSLPIVTPVDSIYFVNGFPIMHFSLENPEGESYFAIKVTGHNKLLIRDSATMQVIDSISQEKNLSLESLEKILDTDKELNVSRLPFSTFTDQFFSGNSFDLNFRLLPEEVEGSIYQTRVDSVTFEIRHISSGYYNFVRSYNQAKPTFGGPFGSFQSINGNVTGGFGVFAGCNMVIVKLPIAWD